MREARAIFSESVLRPRDDNVEKRVTFVELFFDLVFVFTVIQLSHSFAHHYSLLGAVETGLLVMAVWWVWNYTAWMTNWLDPEAMPVRFVIFALMFLALVLSIAIPSAFEGGGLLFALVYVAMQVGRTVFAALAFRGHWPENHLNFVRITIWLLFSAIFWIAGALASHEARVILWALAIAIEYVSPALGFRVPFLGRSRAEEWEIAGDHFAERSALFVIICLGETILVSGRTIAEMAVSFETIALTAAAFMNSATLWWIYFRYGHSRGAAVIERSATPGSIARIAFTYAHIPIVAGIIVTAVSTEMMLAHPDDAAGFRGIAALVGGPALFLGGTLWFKAAVWIRTPLSHIVGLGLLAALAIASRGEASFIALYLAVLVILIVVALWEMLSLGRGGERLPKAAEEALGTD